MIENLPVWVKAIFTAFVGGFAGAALMAIGDISTGGPVDYKKAFTAGLAGGIVAVLAYLKPSPQQVVKMLLIGTLLAASTLQMACGNQTTLAKAGVILTTGAAAYKNELSNLRIQNVIDDAKFNRLNTQADQIIVLTGELSTFLNSLTTVDSKNAAQVILKVAEVTGKINAAIQNTSLGNVPANSKAVRILNIGVITLNEIAMAISIISPKPAEASFSSVGGGSSEPVSASKAKVKLPDVPKDIRDLYFSK